MPTSSTSARPGTSNNPTQASSVTSSSSRRNYWPTSNHSTNNNNSKHSNYSKRALSTFSNSSSTSSSQQHKKSSKVNVTNNQSASNNNKAHSQQQHHHHIRHISSPSSVGSTSTTILKGNTTQMVINKNQSVSVTGGSSLNIGSTDHLVVTKPSGSPHSGSTHQQLDSLASIHSLDNNNKHTQHQSNKSNKSSSYQQQLVNSIQLPTSHSQISLNQANTTTSNSSSTAQLHSYVNANHQTTSFSIKRNVNLKYIKTIIILLLALDLVITVFVHQFSTQDYLSIWFTSLKLRFSLLNLILSAIWFVILVGAILFDIYFIIFISSIVHFSSFILLLIFSFIHFTRRIDYNSVNLTSLLGLLFSIIILHVYLIAVFALTIYLMQAVRRRQKVPQ